MAVIKTTKERKGRSAVQKAAGPQKNRKAKQPKKSPGAPGPKASGLKAVRQETVRREPVKRHSNLKGRITSVRQFFSGVWQELKKVHWPTRREVAIYTGVVLAVVTIVMIIIWIADSIFSQLLRLIVA
ncbi:MAG TPA: preprotein translocase subunit SecE [Desulfotomaculum sp.]|nr:preprotein translocase subunit SecE [Desulfotomaculum sp.]